MIAIERMLASALIAVSLASVAMAQETRLGEEGFESPPATLDQIEWLQGQWVGEGIQGAPAMESWLPPTGGTMVGTFIQETPEGAIMFTEHLYLMEEEGTLVLRLKHFNADLTGWEEKDDLLTFRLVAIKECAAYFNALTLRCSGDGGLVAAVRMKSDGPEPRELVFRFERMGSANLRPCPDAETTLAIDACFADLLAASQERRARYFAAAIERANGEGAPGSALIDQMQVSEAEFETYLERECSARYEAFKDGSIRNFMYLRCAIELNDERAHTIWQHWLTYMDSSPPVLPEPTPML